MSPSFSLRVAHVITGLNTGGAEAVLCRLLESLRPPQFTHSVIVLGRQGTLSARVAKHAEIQHLGMRATLSLPRDLWRLRRLLQAGMPDVIHAWMHHANLMATLAALGTGIPVLWGIRQSLYDLHREKRATRLVIRANRTLSRRPAWIVYNSSTGAMQHEAFGFGSARRLIIPNGFDVVQFHADVGERVRVRAELSIAPGNLVIGLIARWHPMKDHANFLHAAALLSRSYPRAVFVLVGDGLDCKNAEVTSLIHSLGLDNKVRLCGRRVDIAAVNAALDIASSSSSWGEGFPNAIGEAMACGVSCVATDVGDVREIIGDTGIVVPPRDPAALCAGWARLAGMGQAERHKLGLRARQRIVERYSLASMADQYASLYSEVTGIN